MRGGLRRTVSLDFEAGQRQYNLEAAHELTAERLYERRWALTFLEQVLGRLQEEMVAAGRSPLFDRLKVFLTGEDGAASYQEAARELGLTEGALRVRVHRLRGRFRELALAEIEQTVSTPEDVAE